MPHMLLWRHAKDDHVINVTPSKGHDRENLIHHFLKLSRCILQAKWKNPPMVQLMPHHNQLPKIRFLLDFSQVLEDFDSRI